MINQRRSALLKYVDGLQASGRTVFTAGEAEQALGVQHRAFLDSAERLQRRRVLMSPRQGFYVIVPPNYAHWGAPPPTWYINAFMKNEGQPYYVGLLKAGEHYGATHQAVMAFQVVTSKRFSEIRAGRSRIAFYYCKDLEPLEEGIEECRADAGTMKISSPELTALDILRYPQASGGIDNVATVLRDMGERINRDKLAFLSRAMKKPVVQRLGHLLERFGLAALTGPMFRELMKRGQLLWVELDRRQVRDPDFTPAPLERDPRWHVVVRRVPELDW